MCAQSGGASAESPRRLPPPSRAPSCRHSALARAFPLLLITHTQRLLAFSFFFFFLLSKALFLSFFFLVCWRAKKHPTQRGTRALTKTKPKKNHVSLVSTQVASPGDLAVVEATCDRLTDSAPNVRETAAAAVISMARVSEASLETALSTLVKHLRHWDASVRWAVTDVLGSAILLLSVSFAACDG